MRLTAGIIGSSGGSALAAAHSCISAAGHALELVVLTDRCCGLSDWARGVGYKTLESKFTDRAQFSAQAFDFFDANQCTEVLLFYTRILAAPLIDSLRVWNIHPALLPAFPGLGGVQQAFEAKVAILGATLHTVDEGMDTGPVFCQLASPIAPDRSLQYWMRVSFVQKVALTLIWFEYLAQGHVGSTCAMPLSIGPTVSSHGISDGPLRRAFETWEAELQVRPAH